MVEIRKAQSSDEKAVFNLAFQLATSFRPEATAFAIQFNRVLSTETEVVLVAEGGGRMIGYCFGLAHSAFYSNGPIAWLEELFVVEEKRGDGVGALLMSAFEEWSREQGCVLVTLATRRAANFYLRIGYERSAEYFKKVLA